MAGPPAAPFCAMEHKWEALGPPSTIGGGTIPPPRPWVTVLRRDADKREAASVERVEGKPVVVLRFDPEYWQRPVPFAWVRASRTERAPIVRDRCAG